MGLYFFIVCGFWRRVLVCGFGFWDLSKKHCFLYRVFYRFYLNGFFAFLIFVVLQILGIGFFVFFFFVLRGVFLFALSVSQCFSQN